MGTPPLVLGTGTGNGVLYSDEPVNRVANISGLDSEAAPAPAYVTLEMTPLIVAALEDAGIDLLDTPPGADRVVPEPDSTPYLGGVGEGWSRADTLETRSGRGSSVRS